MSLANSSPRAALLGVLLLVSLTAQNLVRDQLTPAPVLTCHSFYCFGETCYQEAKFSNQMAECEPRQQRREEKVCATFSCQGSECFKGQKAVAMCPKGLDFCELKQSSSGYTAGCSQTCVSRIYRCHGAMVQACSQECSQASVSGSPRSHQESPVLSLAGAMLLLLLHSALLPFTPPWLAQLNQGAAARKTLQA